MPADSMLHVPARMGMTVLPALHGLSASSDTAWRELRWHMDFRSECKVVGRSAALLTCTSR